MRWPQASFADCATGISSDPQVRHSTKRVASGTHVVECRLTVDPDNEGAGLLDLFDEDLTDSASMRASGTRSNLADVVVLRLNDGRTYAEDLRELTVLLSPTWEMLSSGVTSSSTMGRLRRREGLECLDRLFSECRLVGLSSGGSSTIGSNSADGLGAYTYSSFRCESLLCLAAFSLSRLLLLCRLLLCLLSLVDALLELDTKDGLDVDFDLDVNVEVDDIRRRSCGDTL